MSYIKGKDKKLTVGFFSPGWPPETTQNGVVTYVSSIVDGLSELGHQSHIFAPPFRKQSPTQTAIDITRGRPSDFFEKLHTRINSEIYYANDFAKNVQRNIKTLEKTSRLDLFEMEESMGLPHFLKRRINTPIITRLHGPWFLNGAILGLQTDDAFTRRVQREGKAIAEALAISAPSRNVLELTREYYGLPLEEAVVIPYPIASVPKTQQWKIETCDRNLIVFIGRFDRHKGGDLMIDAFAKTIRQKPDLKLCFIGPDRGFKDNYGRVWQLEEYIQERLPNALEKGQISWLGAQPPQTLREMRLRAYLTVVPSRYETFGYTALEALSQGCPIVGADSGGIPEIISDGITGQLFRSGDSEDLAIKITHLLNNPEVVAKMGEQAGQNCERRFSLKAIAQQSLDFYHEVLERHIAS